MREWGWPLRAASAPLVPGRAPVGAPSAHTATPFTSTDSMPLEGVVGLSQSARSSTRSGSKIVRPRSCLASPYRPVGRFICCAIPTRCGGAYSPMQTLLPWSRRAYGSPATRRASTSTWTCRLSRGVRAVSDADTCERREVGDGRSYFLRQFKAL
jgi:hypothetical protein